MCACVCEHAFEQGHACVYMTADQGGKWRGRQRRGESGRHYAAAEWERKEWEKGEQENHRQIERWDRNEAANELAGRRCGCIHRKQMQTRSKNEPVSMWAGRVRIWLWNVFTLSSLQK